MKKTFILMITAIILGGVTGNVLYKKYKQIDSVLNEEDKVFVLQEGVYVNKESLNRNTKDLNPKIVERKDNKYYVYLGISKSQEGIKKIQKLYSKKGYSTNSKELEVKNDAFLANLIQYDILLESSKTDEDILTIEEVVLSGYEEITKK